MGKPRHRFNDWADTIIVVIFWIIVSPFIVLLGLDITANWFWWAF